MGAAGPTPKADGRPHRGRHNRTWLVGAFTPAFSPRDRTRTSPGLARDGQGAELSFKRGPGPGACRQVAADDTGLLVVGHGGLGGGHAGDQVREREAIAAPVMLASAGPPPAAARQVQAGACPPRQPPGLLSACRPFVGVCLPWRSGVHAGRR